MQYRNPFAFSMVMTVLVVVALLSGCSSTRLQTLELEPGMPKSEVVAILGTPHDRSIRGPDEALQYQELVGFGQCKYTTVWLTNGVLVGVTSRRGGSVAGCGLGSREVDWRLMPTQE